MTHKLQRPTLKGNTLINAYGNVSGPKVQFLLLAMVICRSVHYKAFILRTLTLLGGPKVLNL